MPGKLLINGIETDNEDLEFNCIGAGKTIKFKRDGVEVASIGDGGISGLPGANQICKAWVNFDGGGTVFIRDSFNISSITDLGTGEYSVHLSAAMATTNYSVVVQSLRYIDSGNNSVDLNCNIAGGVESSSKFRIATADGTANNAWGRLDHSHVYAVVFGN